MASQGVQLRLEQLQLKYGKQKFNTLKEEARN
jgi:hypothetical protein